jgi:hypothetical protein
VARAAVSHTPRAPTSSCGPLPLSRLHTCCLSPLHSCNSQRSVRACGATRKRSTDEKPTPQTPRTHLAQRPETLGVRTPEPPTQAHVRTPYAPCRQLLRGPEAAPLSAVSLVSTLPGAAVIRRARRRRSRGAQVWGHAPALQQGQPEVQHSTRGPGVVQAQPAQQQLRGSSQRRQPSVALPAHVPAVSNPDCGRRAPAKSLNKT